MNMIAVSALALTLGAASVPACAAEILFSGSGVFGPDISSQWPAALPGASFAFSFGLPNPIASNPTNEVTNSMVSVGGLSVSEPITSVTFYPADFGGGFDLNFPDGVVSLFLADVGSTLTLITGTYSFTLGDPRAPEGSGTVTLTAVPEPATWAMMLVGFGGLGALLRRRRRPTFASA